MNQSLQPVALYCLDGALLCLDGPLQCLVLMDEIVLPVITSAQIMPNPVPMNTKFKLSVGVEEQTVYVEPFYYNSGEVYSGEVDA